jgi:hypothetical protein
LLVQFGKQLVEQIQRDKLVAEPVEHRVVGHALLEAQADEAPEAQPVAQRLLQFALAQPIQRPQQQGLEQNQRRPRRTTRPIVPQLAQ